MDARTLILDLSAPDFMKTIIEITRVGRGLGDPFCGCIIGDYLDSLEQHRTLVDVNVRSTMELAHYFRNQFKAKKKRRADPISSASALQGSALVQHYAASKAYILTFAEGLWYELRPYGVDVLGHSPASTDTPAIYVGNQT